VLLRETGSKAAYALPKNANKQTRYLVSLTGLLSLTTGQQQQAGSIFTSAVNNRIGINATIKSVRKLLTTAVKSNDTVGIAQAASQIGSLMTQYVTNGAAANAAFYQMLTPAQQATLSQYQGLKNGIAFA
jgi:Spy/CpxP family protein refolding chaperone